MSEFTITCTRIKDGEFGQGTFKFTGDTPDLALDEFITNYFSDCQIEKYFPREEYFYSSTQRFISSKLIYASNLTFFLTLMYHKEVEKHAKKENIKLLDKIIPQESTGVESLKSSKKRNTQKVPNKDRRDDKVEMLNMRR